MDHLTFSFYERDPVIVARDLLGKYLIHDTPEGQLIGKIVEVEAYGGLQDKGSHASRGITDRTQIMFDKPGFSYVYLIYGMHYCLNASAHITGQAGAILLRALEPIGGIELMKKNRGKDSLRDLCSGPGKLCQALGVNKNHNGRQLIATPLRIAEGEPVTEDEIVATPRINIDYAGEAKDWPWRFYIKGNLFISRK